MDGEAGLVAGMARLAARLPSTGRVAGTGEPPSILSRRADRLVVRRGDVVLKAHPDGTDPRHLAARLGIAARSDLAGVLLPPLTSTPMRVGARLVSAWPAGRALGPRDADAAPWERAGALLARLHRAPVGLGDLAALPPATVLRRLADRVARLRPHAGHPLVDPILAATATLGDPSAAAGPGRPTSLVHGDFHFGQLVHLGQPPAPPAEHWRIIDVDDLGLGDPAWDLARPAAWFAAGLLPVDRWARFLDAYTAHGGPALPGGDPWRALDLPARALTVEYAATAVAAHLDPADLDPAHLEPARLEAARLEADSPGGLDQASAALVEACGRIVATAGPASSSRRVGH
ncbi:putative aminoglycoside phosphotransferase [Frankia canadensis]|uniref:Putative aminoglycoside phosphotransferase n=1 Tax=Frankia canadensis TaxID=1836972 RepID=A0A2I2KT22_9ACTN|nr:aminoglycoside phosphotransferase family protein [Frankia canadensis]SNQ48789.1 putative aminoglycoside phosphotransferase [Frankia canadensis]SOU56079.1 putative aminoglycoside phosphotransferase [Frankia canadensis]